MSTRAHIIVATLALLLAPLFLGAGAQGASDLARVAQTVTPGQLAEVGVVPWRSQRFGNYYALAIGIDGYSHLSKAEQLTTAINDAHAVAKLLLERYGFDIKILRNARRQTILYELARLRAELTETDRLLLYYAGRSYVDRENQRCYWWPADTNPNDPATWILSGDITAELNAMKATHVLIVADACYTATQPYRSQAPPGDSEKRDTWLRQLSKMRSRTALTSGSLHPLTETGASQYSIFANALLQALRNNERVLEGARLFESLGPPSVYAVIDGAGHRNGDFLLVPRSR